MGVDDQRQLGHRILDGGDQIIGVLGAHDTGHILDADGLHTHALQVLHHLNVLLQGVNRAGGEADGAGGVGALLVGLVNGHLQIAHVVECVKNPDDVDAVLHGVLHKLAHHVVGVVLIAQDVLAAEQHLQLGVGHLGADLAQPLPGVLPQIAQAYVKGGAAPHLGGVEAGLIHGLQDGLKLVVGEAGCDQRLVRVAQYRLRKLYLSHVESTSKYSLVFSENSDLPSHSAFRSVAPAPSSPENSLVSILVYLPPQRNPLSGKPYNFPGAKKEKHRGQPGRKLPRCLYVQNCSAGTVRHRSLHVWSSL